MRSCGDAVLQKRREPTGACLSMVAVNHPVGEHTRGQQPKANLTTQRWQPAHGRDHATCTTSAKMVP